MENKRTFLHDAIEMISMGSRAIESDDFSKCFAPNALPNRNFTVGRFFSIFIRHCILFPIRLIFGLLGFCILSSIFVFAEYFEIHFLINKIFFAFMKLFAITLNIHLRHFGRKERRKTPTVYVSNHTSFLDFVVLSSYKFDHACVAEHHNGLFGFIFDFIISKNGSISFKRSEKQDKQSVLTKINQHLLKNGAPMLIFPEGTCVNNKYSVLFQKGAFELNAAICPVAINYRKNFVDPYWNRRKQGFVGHLIYLLTRWRIDADVYWMDPLNRAENETPIEFGHRVKKIISDKIHLKNKAWNGYFKSQPMHGDGDIFRQCFKNVYRKCNYGKLELNSEDDLYLNYYNLEDSDEKELKYFGKITYESFTNECCKEYLRIKSLSLKDRETLFNSEFYCEKNNLKNYKKIISCNCSNRNK